MHVIISFYCICDADNSVSDISQKFPLDFYFSEKKFHFLLFQQNVKTKKNECETVESV